MNLRPRYLALFLCGLLALPVSAQDVDKVLHVKQQHASASDDNPGTADQPLLTIQEGMDRAQDEKESGVSVKVAIGPGMYRESVTFAYTNHPGNQPNNDTPVFVEGAGPGQTIISGAERFENWQEEGSGVYSHSWTHDWGLADDPSGGYIPNPEIVLRREMVFFDDAHLQQVLTAGEMTAGTFRVDEAADKIFIMPPGGQHPQNAVVEVAVRAEGWLTRHENNLTLKGFTVQRLATPWQYGAGGIVVSGSENVRLEDIEALYSNSMGLTLQLSTGVELSNVVSNHNGHSGWDLFKLVDFWAEDLELSYNNWRGHLGGYVFWGPGNKSSNVHGMTIDGLTSVGNQSRGLWLDTDHTDVTLSNLDIRENLKSGIFIEAIQGPVAIDASDLSNNGEYAIENASSREVNITNSTFVGNQLGGLHISGDVNGRDITDFETGETLRVRSEEWTFVGNTVAGGDNYLIGTTFGQSAWGQFTSTLTSDENTWWDSDRPDAFEWHDGEMITLDEWQSRTAEDLNSSFEAPGSNPTGTDENIPEQFSLSPAYPNPFSEQTTIELVVEKPQRVVVTLYDTLGRQVSLIHEGEVVPGTQYHFEIDGRSLASGTYIYTVVGEQFRKTGKAVRVR